MALFLVTHGRLVGSAAGAELDPAGFDEVWALRDRLPQGAAWFCTPHPAAVATCQLLTEGEVGIAAHLHGHDPAREDAETARQRVLRGVRGVLDSHPGEDVVLVGEPGTWQAVLRDLAPGLDPVPVLGTPDVLTLPEPLASER
ncbi:hypothetical protein [Nocardioides pantholopis]|uniref:hypothetical protein n=1 Tax=Nocardioides pantholopis TaxID=2483798 RepID=UPI000FD92799|nr:hypothetical protein [Nocardioides pantholopis]